MIELKPIGVIDYRWYIVVNNVKQYIDAMSTKKNKEADDFYKDAFHYLGVHTVKSDLFENIEMENKHCYIKKKETAKDIEWH